MASKRTKIWLDGKLLPWEKAQIHVLTHTFHYGGGVFEGIRFYKTPSGTAVFRLNDHINRLFYSASCLEMKIPYTKAQLAGAILNLIKINKLDAGYIRPICFFGAEHLGIHPQGCRVHCAIAIWPWGAYLGNKPVKTRISSFIRIHPKSTHAEAKICGNYVNSILASQDAIKHGCQEAILLDYKGNVSEGPGENIFYVKNGVLLTPMRGNILVGITRSSVIELAGDLKIKVKEKKVSLREFCSADEAFFTGTAAQISSIGYVNGKKVGKGDMGPLTQKLAHLLDKVVHGHVPKYAKWLTPVF